MNWNRFFIMALVVSFIQLSFNAQGDTFTKNEKEALAFFKIAYAADKKDDYEIAFTHYLKAAELGHLEAIFSVGSMYENGLGVLKSSSKAMLWYKKATLQNYAKAQNELGFMYAKGMGVTKNYKKGIYWYQQLSEGY